VIEALEGRALLASIASTTPYHGQQQVAVGANLSVTFGEAMNASTLTTDRVTLRDGLGNVLLKSLSYNAATRVLSIDPTANLLSNSDYYALQIAGGTGGVRASDGSALTGDYVVSFTCGTPNITSQTVFSGLNKPTNIEFAPDGRIYVAEQSGIIKLFDSLTDTTPTQVADFRTNVHNFWDRGLLGMTLDPQFTTGRPFVYVLYTYDALIGATAPRWGAVGGTSDPGGTNAATNGATVSGRLSRFTVNGAGVMTGNEQVLINDWAQQFPSHSIGDLKFGPDGYLYASAGDGASFNIVDYGQVGNPFNDPVNEGGALRSLDILSDSDPTGLDGTIIRVDPDTGAAAPGNPYASSTDANKRRIIAAGLRNPFRITFRPGTSEIYLAETGWNTWEEINRIANASDAVAENFGWPAYEGPNRQSGYDGQNLPLIENFYTTPSAHSSPWFAYNHNAPVVSGSGEPTGGSTPTGVAFYESGTYPTAYAGAFFFSDFARQRVYVMYKGPDGQINQASRQVFDTAQYVELTTGPGGDLFAVNLLSGTITRYVASGYNRTPVATLTADRTTGLTPLTVNFDARASYDPDGAALTFAWDLDGDGNFNDGTGPTATRTYTQPADVVTRVRVTDPLGLSAVATLTINVGNRAPVPTITAPLTTLRWSVGETVNFSGSATDPEDGTLAPSRLRWDLILVHGNEIDPGNTHEHQITSYTGVASGSFVAPDHESPSWLILRLTATDTRGLATTTQMRVDPKLVAMNFTTSPSGLKVIFNGTEFIAPFSRTVIAGSANSVAAVTPQTLGAARYQFGSWNIGGPSSQSLTAPAADAGYQANFVGITLVKQTGVVIGTTGSWNNSGNTRDKAFDGSLATYFDAPADVGWTGLDLGTAKMLSQIRYAPRSGWASRMVGGAFQASNDPAFASGVVNLHTIPSIPAEGVLTSIDITPSAAHRYVRYLSPAGGFANVAEIEFYADQAVVNPPAVPAAPTGLTAAVSPGPTVQLTWSDASDNETRFVIQRRYTNWIWEELPLAVGANATSVIDTTAIGNVSYEYRIAAQNAAGTSGWSNSVFVNTNDIGVQPPPAPTSLIATAINAGRVDLAWDDNSATETAFRIDRRVVGGTFAELFSTAANVRTYSDTTVSAGVAYEYRVVALAGAVASTASNTASVIVPGGVGVPAAPDNLTATADPDISVRLTWRDNSTNESGFRIERRYSNWIWGEIAIVGPGVTSYIDRSVYAGVEYEYRISAIGPGGNSAPSAGVIVRLPSQSVTATAPELRQSLERPNDRLSLRRLDRRDLLG
jgi:glucose/arabinose dehydrogenase